MYVTFKQFYNARKKIINYKFDGYPSCWKNERVYDR